jgi:predicted nucleic acid-binding protein
MVVTMEKPRIYLETTVFSFYHETREYGEYPKYKAQVREIFERIKAGKFEPYTSIFVTDEIAKEKNAEKLEKIQELIAEHDITFLEVTDEADRIAKLYIQEGAISPTWETDAAHIAMATVNGLDFIVSLNFTHIVRTWTIERVRRVNRREGYQGIGIYKPEEVLEL